MRVDDLCAAFGASGAAMGRRCARWSDRSPAPGLADTMEIRLKTPGQRAEERRREKLAEMQRQIDEGTLTIRKMTAKERAEYPPQPRPKRRRRPY